VQQDGSVSLKGDPRVIYFIMLQTRAWVCSAASRYVLVACRWVTRYSVCRRQFKDSTDSGEERKLLDYQTHLYICGTHLATTLTNILTSMKLMQLLDICQQQVKAKNYEMLNMLHHITAGFKVIMIEDHDKAFSELRQCCGGAGYLLSSGIGGLFTDSIPAATYEGTSTILSKEASRYLLKLLAQIDKGEAAPSTLGYLTNYKALKS